MFIKIYFEIKKAVLCICTPLTIPCIYVCTFPFCVLCVRARCVGANVLVCVRARCVVTNVLVCVRARCVGTNVLVCVRARCVGTDVLVCVVLI